MKLALVHDWLTGMRGGERVLERLCALWPDATISTLVWKRGAVSPAIEAHPIRTSFLQRLPDAERRYRWYLPLFPAAIERFDFRGFDAVISTSHAVARAARAPAGTFHYAYVFTPMRYIWELEHDYFPPGRFPWPASAYVHGTCARLRAWERATANRPDVVTAISRHVAERIRRHWGRDAGVIYPPVELTRFNPARGPGDYYLLAGAMAPYKRGELAIEACAALGRRLVVVGTGQQAGTLRRLAGGTIEFREGWVSDEEMARLYAGARALLYPGEEDFGIIPLEALASGCPVIAFGRGGAVETVGRGASPEALAALAHGADIDVPGGVLFGEQSAAALARAITRFESLAFDPQALASLARPFGAERFDQEFRADFERQFTAWRAQPRASTAR